MPWAETKTELREILVVRKLVTQIVEDEPKMAAKLSTLLSALHQTDRTDAVVDATLSRIGHFSRVDYFFDEWLAWMQASWGIGGLPGIEVNRAHNNVRFWIMGKNGTGDTLTTEAEFRQMVREFVP